jgi:Holliday junction resolvasome RuvABC endonuclease subunit
VFTVGIDYSLTCPAACAYDPDPTKVQFWYAHETKHLDVPNVRVDTIVPGTVIERAAVAAANLCRWIQTFGVSRVTIEDYAYGAAGRVFHLGENGGVLKYELWKMGVQVDVISPSAAKKHGTGKGNAQKDKMTAAFVVAYPAAASWVPTLFPRTKGITPPAKSPLADLADAFWISHYAHVHPVSG